MALTVNDMQFRAVSALDPAGRLEHFLGRVVDESSAWGLHDAGGWTLLADDAEQMCFPLWPHPRYAEAWAVATSTPGATAEAISLDDLLDELLPKLSSDGLRVAVFPVPLSARSATIAAARLESLLRQRLVDWFGDD